jgi:hypothetical protein
MSGRAPHIHLGEVRGFSAKLERSIAVMHGVSGLA